MAAARSGASPTGARQRAAGGLLFLATTVLARGQAGPHAGLKFSHRFHLEKTGARCADCHSAVAASTAAGDRLLPAEKDCLRCHDGHRARNECGVCHVEGKRPPAAAAAVPNLRFNHQLHLAMGDFGPALAAAIDGGKYLAPPAEARSVRSQLGGRNACAACHRGVERAGLATAANMPRMADCLVCHDRIEPPFSCEKCHMNTAVLKPASHTAEYLESHSRRDAQLDKAACRICHGENFRCMGCH